MNNEFIVIMQKNKRILRTITLIGIGLCRVVRLELHLPYFNV